MVSLTACSGNSSDGYGHSALTGLTKPTMTSELHEIVFAGERLVVMTPPATYLLATKLRAAREQDVPDVLRLMHLSGRTSEREPLDLLEVAYPSARLTPRMHYFAVQVAAVFS